MPYELLDGLHMISAVDSPVTDLHASFWSTKFVYFILSLTLTFFFSPTYLNLDHIQWQFYKSRLCPLHYVRAKSKLARLALPKAQDLPSFL